MLLNVSFTDINNKNPHDVSMNIKIKANSSEEMGSRMLQLHGKLQKQLFFPHGCVFHVLITDIVSNCKDLRLYLFCT